MRADVFIYSQHIRNLHQKWCLSVGFDVLNDEFCVTWFLFVVAVCQRLQCKVVYLGKVG